MAAPSEIVTLKDLEEARQAYAEAYSLHVMAGQSLVLAQSRLRGSSLEEQKQRQRLEDLMNRWSYQTGGEK